MEVFVEVVIIDNLFLTFLCGLLSYRFLSLKPNYKRLIFASVFGTVVAVFYPFMGGILLTNLVRVALALTLSFILFYKKCNYFKGIATFLIVTFFFGGVLFFISMIVHGDVVSALTITPTNVPIGLIIAGGLIAYYLLKRLITNRKRLQVIESQLIKIELEIFGKVIEGEGFLDTGNTLHDSVSSLPVVILTSKTITKALDDEKLMLFTLGKGEKIDGAHYEEYSTLGNKKNKILILKPQKMKFFFGQTEHKIVDVALGLPQKISSNFTKFDFILPPQILQ
ncbi:MAG: sigma-E processing peptidase SpoIIGA [Firmicutes bacterium]|nr:sigma-E processing peptidase SpoIIGA [Bacillota bacterium]